MKKLTKEQFFNLLAESKSDDPIKVSDLIEMLKPFEDYYLYDPRCHYCSGLYLISEPGKEENLKRKSDAILLIEYSNGKYQVNSLEQHLQDLKNNEDMMSESAEDIRERLRKQLKEYGAILNITDIPPDPPEELKKILGID